MKEYKLTGYVYGNYWGGGKGAYPSEVLRGNDLKKLLSKANEMLESGALDSGMGYESLIGALIDVETIETIEKNGKQYSNSEYETEYIGKLTESEKGFYRNALTRCNIKTMQELTVEEEISLLRETMRKLSAKRYKRFNVLLKNEVYNKLEGQAIKDGTSKARCLSKMIGVYQ